MFGARLYNCACVPGILRLPGVYQGVVKYRSLVCTMSEIQSHMLMVQVGHYRYGRSCPSALMNSPKRIGPQAGVTGNLFR